MRTNKGLTASELIMVIIIIVVLFWLFIPPLPNERVQATMVVCLGNTMTLAKGWIAYSDENQSTLIGGDIGQSEYDWIPKPVVIDSTDIEGYKSNIQKGKLWPYVNNIRAYHCPNDKRLDDDDGPYLSYSIVGGLNGQDRYEEDKRKYKVATKFDQIEFPEEKIIFVEENAEFGWNPRSWQIYNPQDLTQWTWQDPIAIRHNNRNVFSFADGHAAIRKWQDERTLAMSQPPAETGTISGHTVGHVEQTDNPDLTYMKKAYTWLPE